MGNIDLLQFTKASLADHLDTILTHYWNTRVGNLKTWFQQEVSTFHHNELWLIYVIYGLPDITHQMRLSHGLSQFAMYFHSGVNETFYSRSTKMRLMLSLVAFE